MSKKKKSLKHSLNVSGFSTTSSPQSNFRNLIKPKTLLLQFQNDKPNILLSHQPLSTPTAQITKKVSDTENEEYHSIESKQTISLENMDKIAQDLKENKSFRFFKTNSPLKLNSSRNLEKMLSNKLEYSISSLKASPRNDLYRLKNNEKDVNFASFNNKINLINRRSMQTMNFDSNSFINDDEGIKKSIDKNNLKNLLTSSPRLFKKSSMAAMFAKKSDKNSSRE